MKTVYLSRAKNVIIAIFLLSSFFLLCFLGFILTPYSNNLYLNMMIYLFQIPTLFYIIVIICVISLSIIVFSFLKMLRKRTGEKIGFKNVFLSSIKIGFYISSAFFVSSFYWNVIPIIYGLILLFSKKFKWKIHGIVLTFSVLITMIFSFNGYSIVNIFEVIFIAAYIIISLFLYYKKKAQNIVYFKLSRKIIIGKKTKALMNVCLVILPLIAWGSYNINLEVMFDNAPRTLWVHVPTTAEMHDEFQITIEAWDQFERVSATYKGTVQLSIKSYDLMTFSEIASPLYSMPFEYTFTGQSINQGIVPAYYINDGKDNGIHEFAATIGTEGIHYIIVDDDEFGGTFWSNPIIVSNDQDIIAWGDLHSHSMSSDGSGVPADIFTYARNVAKVEFCALTDHGENLDFMDLGTEYINLCDYNANQINSFNDPPNFVTFNGIEWTTGYAGWSIFNHYGHYAIVTNATTIPYISSMNQETPFELWEALDDFREETGADLIAVPHHMNKDGFWNDWTWLNPEYVRLGEVSSIHGESLFDGGEYNGTSITSGLLMGKKITINAAGDSHDGFAGHSLMHTDVGVGHQYPYSLVGNRQGKQHVSGLTAVHTEGLTRNEIFSSLRNGTVYANSDYGRPYVNFTINDIPVYYNSSVHVTTPNTRVIRIVIAQDGNPAAMGDKTASMSTNPKPYWDSTVEIYKNGKLFTSIPISTPIAEIIEYDNEPITGDSYNYSIRKEDGKYYVNDISPNPIEPSDLNSGGADFYFIRVVQNSVRKTYAGTIWAYQD